MTPHETGCRSVTMATPAAAFTQLASDCEAGGLNPKNAERIGRELARTFAVKEDEVGILRIEKQNLMFVYPIKLHNVGSIPLNTTQSVAVRTANSRRPELINNFAQTKHTSVFEAVQLTSSGVHQVGEKPPINIIQKLMSAPVLGGAVALGVIQISRKGPSGPAAGPDFTPADLQKLVAAAAALAKCFK
jgi:hypothetical protein